MKKLSLVIAGVLAISGCSNSTPKVAAVVKETAACKKLAETLSAQDGVGQKLYETYREAWSAHLNSPNDVTANNRVVTTLTDLYNSDQILFSSAAAQPDCFTATDMRKIEYLLWVTKGLIPNLQTWKDSKELFKDDWYSSYLDFSTGVAKTEVPNNWSPSDDFNARNSSNNGDWVDTATPELLVPIMNEALGVNFVEDRFGGSIDPYVKSWFGSADPIHVVSMIFYDDVETMNSDDILDGLSANKGILRCANLAFLYSITQDMEKIKEGLVTARINC